jgi:hypothetical protein
MELVWAALGAGAIFAIFSLFASRRRFQTQQSWARRRLTSRMAEVERESRFDPSASDSEPAQSFIEQVCVFSMSLTERFWNQTLQATAEEMAFIHENGAFLSTVKIERGHSHVIVTVAEVLPERRAAEWHIRSFELFPGSSSLNRGGVILWELRTAELPEASHSFGYRGVELRFEQNSLALSIRDYPSDGHPGRSEPHRRLVARIPLDVGLLSRFRVTDPAANPHGPEGAAKTQARFPADAPSISFFEHIDEEAGLVWHLCRQEFIRRESSARSATVEGHEIRHPA